MLTFNKLLTGDITIFREWASDRGSLPRLVKAYASNGERSLERAQEIVARFADRSGSAADDLIAERRAESAREGADDNATYDRVAE